MKCDRIDPERGPTPQQLGAYADGELSAADRDSVDAWLRRHPDQAAEVEALRNLSQLWHDTPPPQPSDEVWSTVRNQIEGRLPQRPPRGHGRENKPQESADSFGFSRLKPKLPARFGLAVAAAAVIALVMLSKGPTPPSAADEEPYPVVTADDVDIRSIYGDDCNCLVAAQPPVGQIDERDLATPDDVLVLNLEPQKDDGTVADLRFGEGAPMIVTPPAGWEHDP